MCRKVVLSLSFLSFFPASMSAAPHHFAEHTLCVTLSRCSRSRRPRPRSARLSALDASRGRRARPSSPRAARGPAPRRHPMMSLISRHRRPTTTPSSRVAVPCVSPPRPRRLRRSSRTRRAPRTRRRRRPIEARRVPPRVLPKSLQTCPCTDAVSASASRPPSRAGRTITPSLTPPIRGDRTSSA